jgi:hypothetical protein
MVAEAEAEAEAGLSSKPELLLTLLLSSLLGDREDPLVVPVTQVLVGRLMLVLAGLAQVHPVLEQREEREHSSHTAVLSNLTK